MKKLYRRFGILIGLLSIGVWPVTEANATTPCPRQCDDIGTCSTCNTGEVTTNPTQDTRRTCTTTLERNEDSPDGTPASGQREECLDCDGDCTPHKVLRGWQNKTCLTICYLETITPPPGGGGGIITVATQPLPPPNLDPDTPGNATIESIDENWCQSKWYNTTNDSCS